MIASRYQGFAHTIKEICIARYSVLQITRIAKYEGCWRKSTMIKFTISLPPITKKNHQQIVRVNGRPMVIPSKQYKQYEKDCSVFLPRIETINEAVNVKAVYYMQTRRRVDLCNLHEALCDVLVRYGVVEDDNSKIIASMDGSRVEYDKENPRTEVTIEKLNSW
jgi:Holliday junction resolvase RusA-like endonuclease